MAPGTDGCAPSLANVSNHTKNLCCVWNSYRSVSYTTDCKGEGIRSLWCHIWGVQSSVMKCDKGGEGYFFPKIVWCHLWTTPYWGPSREGEGEVFLGPHDVWGPTVTQKYKLHQNVPFWKTKFKNCLFRQIPQECFPWPHCGSRRPCTYCVALWQRPLNFSCWTIFSLSENFHPKIQNLGKNPNFGEICGLVRSQAER